MFILLLVWLVYLYCERLARSPYGRLLKAIRENDQIAISLGKIAAISGVLFVTNLGFSSANDYAVNLTLDVWVMIVLGGLGNNRGALLGALLVTVLDRITSITAIQLDLLGSQFEFNYVRFILFGIILLVMLRYRSQGLWPEPIRTPRAHEVLS